MRESQGGETGVSSVIVELEKRTLAMATAITDLLEALFVLPRIVNYSACLTRSLDADRLEVAIYAGSRGNLPDQGEILRALTGVPEIAAATEARH